MNKKLALTGITLFVAGLMVFPVVSATERELDSEKYNGDVIGFDMDTATVTCNDQEQISKAWILLNANAKGHGGNLVILDHGKLESLGFTMITQLFDPENRNIRTHQSNSVITTHGHSVDDANNFHVRGLLHGEHPCRSDQVVTPIDIDGDCRGVKLTITGTDFKIVSVGEQVHAACIAGV